MTPKEKARDLFDSYYYCLLQSDVTQRTYWAKQCALIAVDEIINNCLFEFYSCGFLTLKTKHKEYWQEVKIEIEKL